MLEKFKNIFEGNNSAYGIMKLTGEVTEKGKAVAKAFIKRAPVTDNLWQDHLDGKDPALGIIPINENNMCKWGCIDVDVYNLDHLVLMRNIKGMGFPLVTFRSKSGGAHLFLFAKEFIPAGLMQSKLKAMAKALDFEGSEIFPKQTEIFMDRGDTGNFLNLPYHEGHKGLRYTFKAGGEAAKLEEFFDIYDEWAQTKEEIQAINTNPKEKVKRDEAFPDGPPCLNKLAEQGFGEGSRNNALFNVAVFCKKAFPDEWENKVGEYNMKYMDPPLSYQEVQVTLKSMNKKDYDRYRCKEQPICSVCNPARCRTKKHGVGYGEEEMPELGTLTKIASTPSQYFLDVDGKRVELTKEQLHNPNLFCIEVMDKAEVIIVTTPKLRDWKEIYLKQLFANIQTVQPLKSSEPRDILVGLLQQFTVNRVQARTADDIVNKMAWTDEGFTYFRMDDFYAFAKRNNWEAKRMETTNMIQQLDGEDGRPDIFVTEVRKEIKNQNIRLIKIKAMKKLDPSISPIKYEEVPF
tara:strand:+ start:442 stop:1995 length:1554 start_codon:yes stop_codon:yes gene_type:complete